MKKLFIIFIQIFALFAFFGSSFATDFDVSLKGGIRELRNENYEEALEIFLKLKKDYKSSKELSFYLGKTYKYTGDYLLASKYLKEAIKLYYAYPELIEILFKLKNYDEALSLIETAEGIKEINQGKISFLKGLIFQKKGLYGEAVSSFEIAKSLNKFLLLSSNFQIASTYLKWRRLIKAKEYFNKIISFDKNSELSETAKSRIEKINNILKNYKTWRFSFNSTIQYDDNVVLKPSTGFDEISNENDNSVLNAFKVSYVPRTEDALTFKSSYSVSGTRYFNTETHNLTSQALTISPGYKLKKLRLNFPLTYSYIFLADERYMATVNFKPKFSLKFFKSHMGSFSAGYLNRELLKPSSSNADDRDGHVYSFSVDYIYMFLKGNGMANFKYEFLKDVTNGRNWEYLGNKVSGYILFPINRKFKCLLSADVTLNDYQHADTTYGRERFDRIFTESVKLMWNIFKGFNLSFKYQHSEAVSNIIVYDYGRNVFSLEASYKW